MKKITVEMPDNIDCLIITYLQSVSLGNINVGQRIAGNKDISNGSVVVIDTSMAEDAVEVVRCKDCLRRDNSCGMGEHKWCRLLKQTTSPDDYCSYGKRREDGEE